MSQRASIDEEDDTAPPTPKRRPYANASTSTQPNTDNTSSHPATTSQPSKPKRFSISDADMEAEKRKVAEEANRTRPSTTQAGQGRFHRSLPDDSTKSGTVPIGRASGTSIDKFRKGSLGQFDACAASIGSSPAKGPSLAPAVDQDRFTSAKGPTLAPAVDEDGLAPTKGPSSAPAVDQGSVASSFELDVRSATTGRQVSQGQSPQAYTISNRQGNLAVAAEVEDEDDERMRNQVRDQVARMFQTIDVPLSRERPLDEPTYPEPIQAIEESADDPDELASRKCIWIGIAVMVCLLFAGAFTGIIMGILVSANDNGEQLPQNERQTAPSPTTAGTRTPTQLPTQSPTILEREFAIRNIVDLVAGDTLNSMDSPEYEALLWILNEDEAAVDPKDVSTREIQERYILAVLYFAVGGPTWNEQLQFLSKFFVCEWNGLEKGVECDGSGYIKSIDLSQNNLSGNLPLSVFKLVGLDFLALSDNIRLRGPLPETIGEAQSLKEVGFGGCRLGGSIPTTIGQLDKLEFVQLWGNSITGSIPTEIGGMTNLGYLGLGNNNLIGSIPAFSEMSKLTACVLVDNMLTDNIPPSLTALPNLELLGLRRNMLTGQVPPFNPQNENLESIEIFDNDLSGRLEDWLLSINSKRFSRLWIAGNSFTGTLPSLIGMFTSLRLFALRATEINGSIPRQIGEMTSLEHIDLAGCNMGGIIPTEIGRATLAVSMQLGGNDLVGTIPTEIGVMRELIWLSLEDNLLSGTIPSVLGDLSKLETFHVQGNTDLVGDLTGLFCDSTNLEVSFIDRMVADCRGTNPAVSCSCCDLCCAPRNPGEAYGECF